jgi:hypothetical protein
MVLSELHSDFLLDHGKSGVTAVDVKNMWEDVPSKPELLFFFS